MKPVYILKAFSGPSLLLLASAIASAQFSYSSASASSDAEAGYQNSSSFGREAHDPMTDNGTANASLSSMIDLSSQQGGLTYHDHGTASIQTLVTAGGYEATFSTSGVTQVTGGANTFVGPRADGIVGSGAFFTVSQSGSYAFHMDGTVVSRTANNGDMTFYGFVKDHNPGGNFNEFYAAAASPNFVNVDTTLNLIAGDQYELGFYELTYMIQDGVSGPTSPFEISTTGKFSLGSPAAATPEPATLAIIGLGLAALKRRKGM